MLSLLLIPCGYSDIKHITDFPVTSVLISVLMLRFSVKLHRLCSLSKLPMPPFKDRTLLLCFVSILLISWFAMFVHLFHGLLLFVSCADFTTQRQRCVVELLNFLISTIPKYRIPRGGLRAQLPHEYLLYLLYVYTISIYINYKYLYDLSYMIFRDRYNYILYANLYRKVLCGCCVCANAGRFC